MERIKTSEENTHTRGFMSVPYQQMMQDHIDTIDCYNPRIEVDLIRRFTVEDIRKEITLDNLCKLKAKSYL